MQTSTTSSYSELYSAYASGRLDPAFVLLLETQSMLRGGVRSALAVSEVISGLMLERDIPVSLSVGAGDRALALIEQIEAETAGQVQGTSSDESYADISELPDPLSGVASAAMQGRGWQATAPGIHRLALEVGSELEVELYRIQPGARVPRHTHGGQEFTLVVSGGFSDETGSFGPGDLSVKGPDDTHQPVGDEDGVCFALAVRDAGLRFTGIMGVIQRMLGK
mgnify:CR=1 FL=1